MEPGDLGETIGGPARAWTTTEDMEGGCGVGCAASTAITAAGRGAGHGCSGNRTVAAAAEGAGSMAPCRAARCRSARIAEVNAIPLGCAWEVPRVEKGAGTAGGALPRNAEGVEGSSEWCCKASTAASAGETDRELAATQFTKKKYAWSFRMGSLPSVLHRTQKASNAASFPFGCVTWVMSEFVL
jgi:hypothetical protein